MRYSFLSPEWIAAMRELRAEYAAQEEAATALAAESPERSIDLAANVTVTGPPFGDGPILGHIDIPLRHRVLDLHCALDGLDGARELGQKTIPHQLDDASMILTDLGVDQGFTMGSERSKCTRLVSLNEAAVSDHVSGQDGSEAAFQARSPLRRSLPTVAGRFHAVTQRVE